MNKGDLIEAVASELKLTKTDAGRAVDTVLDCITRGVKQDAKVALAGFGTFARKQRPARTGVNPMTKQPMEIRASTTCNFRPSSALKEAI